MTARIILLVALGAVSGCSVDIPSGVFSCQTDSDCPSGWTCRSDSYCWSTPSEIGADATITPQPDASRDDATVVGPNDDATVVGPNDDATVVGPNDDATVGPNDDAAVVGPNDDATVGPNDDATVGPDDTGVDGGACEPNAGQSCVLADRCGTTFDCAGQCSGGTATPMCGCGAATCTMGAWHCPDPASFGSACAQADRCGGRIDCDGTCSGGTAAPTCACGAATCGANGQWSACPGAANAGQRCMGPGGVCGAVIDCSGACTGGTAAPMCPCGAATCQANGSWSSCPVPQGYDTACSTNQVCGGRVNCDGRCAGGTPPAACPECGTPSCGGCTGAPNCGSSSMCGLDGVCQCNPGSCACPAGAGFTCTLCIGNQVGTCVADPNGCGLFIGTMGCNFGCDPQTPEVCACAPDQGDACVISTCSCNCGDFDREGTVQCNGSCGGPSVGCINICRRECGN